MAKVVKLKLVKRKVPIEFAEMAANFNEALSDPNTAGLALVVIEKKGGTCSSFAVTPDCCYPTLMGAIEWLRSRVLDSWIKD